WDPHSFTPPGTATAQQKVTTAVSGNSGGRKTPNQGHFPAEKLHNQPHQPNTHRSPQASTTVESEPFLGPCV
ncbi:hypothetical protein, partial [Paenarthrobacter aurescens]|uniref:hypothetical protein n=1 Tax=Paenarthrobacter aurescens TaxID=43663 RepID=UPI0035E46E6C